MEAFSTKQLLCKGIVDSCPVHPNQDQPEHADDWKSEVVAKECIYTTMFSVVKTASESERTVEGFFYVEFFHI